MKNFLSNQRNIAIPTMVFFVEFKVRDDTDVTRLVLVQYSSVRRYADDEDDDFSGLLSEINRSEMFKVSSHEQLSVTKEYDDEIPSQRPDIVVK